MTEVSDSGKQESVVGRSGAVAIGVFLVVLVFTALVFSVPQKTPEQRRAEACADSRGAYSVAQDLVAARLKSPKTAQFPRFSAVKATPLGGCRHLIRGYVDAQNGFGALVRTDYTALMVFDRLDRTGAYYTMESLEFAQ